MATATFVKNLDGFNGNATLYRVNPPLKSYSGEDEYALVVVSAVVAFGYPETFIFGADEDGEVMNWLELPGSFKGALDHTRALRDAGYDVEVEPIS
jgi:hypothetical protein